MRQYRWHPPTSVMREMTNEELADYLEREAFYLGDPNGQKQTAIPRALREAAARLRA